MDDIEQTVMVIALVVAVIEVLIAGVNAVTQERMRRIQDFKLAWDMKVWRDKETRRCDWTRGMLEEFV